MGENLRGLVFSKMGLDIHYWGALYGGLMCIQLIISKEASLSLQIEVFPQHVHITCDTVCEIGGGASRKGLASPPHTEPSNCMRITGILPPAPLQHANRTHFRGLHKSKGKGLK